MTDPIIDVVRDLAPIAEESTFGRSIGTIRYIAIETRPYHQ